MSELLEIGDSRAVAASRWPRRYTIAALFFFGTVLCYLDRVSISVAIIPLAADEGYDSAAQGLILSAFFWSYLWPQLAGGWFADRFGGKRVLGFGVAVWSIATFITPGAARTSFTVLFAVRILLGLGEGVNFPAIRSLTARWMPPRERARTRALNFSGMYPGDGRRPDPEPLDSRDVRLARVLLPFRRSRCGLGRHLVVQSRRGTSRSSPLVRGAARRGRHRLRTCPPCDPDLLTPGKHSLARDRAPTRGVGNCTCPLLQ